MIENRCIYTIFYLDVDEFMKIIFCIVFQIEINYSCYCLKDKSLVYYKFCENYFNEEINMHLFEAHQA